MCGASSHGNSSEREIRGCGMLMKVVPRLDDPLGQAGRSRRWCGVHEALVLLPHLLVLLVQEMLLPVPELLVMSQEMLLLVQELLLRFLAHSLSVELSPQPVPAKGGESPG
eukprot:12140818-Heterocapsa_arctica.AAC.1